MCVLVLATVVCACYCGEMKYELRFVPNGLIVVPIGIGGDQDSLDTGWALGWSRVVVAAALGFIYSEKVPVDGV